MPGALPTVILGYRVWNTRYAMDPAVIGRAVRINGTPRTVIGVMPDGFRFPREADLWVPFAPSPSAAPGEGAAWTVMGRLRDGRTLEDARTELAAIGARLSRAEPATHEYLTLTARPYRDELVNMKARAIFRAMLFVVSFVLLIACANATNLLLARALSRRREVAVRTALGAPRSPDRQPAPRGGAAACGGGRRARGRAGAGRRRGVQPAAVAAARVLHGREGRWRRPPFRRAAGAARDRLRGPCPRPAGVAGGCGRRPQGPEPRRLVPPGPGQSRAGGRRSGAVGGLAGNHRPHGQWRGGQPSIASAGLAPEGVLIGTGRAPRRCYPDTASRGRFVRALHRELAAPSRARRASPSAPRCPDFSPRPPGSRSTASTVAADRGREAGSCRLRRGTSLTFNAGLVQGRDSPGRMMNARRAWCW